MRLGMPAPRWADVLVPLAVGVFTTAGTHFASLRQPEARALDLLGTVLLLAGPVLLVGRRWQPVPVFGLVTTVLLIYWTLRYPFGPVPLAAVIALGTAVTSGHRVGSYLTTALAFTASVVTYLVQHPGSGVPLSGSALWLAWLLTFIVGCELLRSRRERLAQARAAREQESRRQGVEERLRIARELHDTLGHHVSLINVQAGTALYLIDDDPEQARTALAAIKQASRDLLTEMRSTLGVLRGMDEDPPRHPVAGLDRLDDLVADSRSAGLPVTVEILGTPATLPPSVDQAAYRIVQESLTNVRRHAGAAQATVRLHYGDGQLSVQIEDDGTNAGASGPSGGGSGLAGMRERVTALGGTLHAGPRARRPGFRVRACLPLAGDRADTP